ncbi:MAG: 1,4-dihydroxy-2-naphthoate octaprenyltransferase [Planctomycetota bacterium]
MFLAARPKFFTASILPVFVGSSLGYLSAGTFNAQLFILAALAIIFIHAGANLANDYYDYKSRNDLLNKNLTPFSGGSRFIPNGLLPPQVIIIEALIALALGALLGLWIAYLTKSKIILTLGIIGTCGAFVYTAPPLKLGYRGLGEIIIAFLFGLFPVYAAYYLQTQVLDYKPLMPALIVSILVFEIILINEFPDLEADAAVNKKTLPVLLGIPLAATIYKLALVTAYHFAGFMLFKQKLYIPGILFFLTLPLGLLACKYANKKDLATPQYSRPNQLTILLHLLGCLALTIGFLITAVTDKF